MGMIHAPSREIRAVALALCASIVVLVACSSDRDASNTIRTTSTSASTKSSRAGSSSPSAQTTTSTTEHPLTTSIEAVSTTATTEPPTTTIDSAEAALQAFAEANRSADRSHLALFAPGSPAYVYYAGIVLLNETDPQTVNLTVSAGGIRIADGPTLSDLVLDPAGLITDLNRNGIPLSQSVAASGAVFEGVDEGKGIVGTVHSFRYFDGNLQVIVTTVNDSNAKGEVMFDEYVSGGRQFNNVFSNSVRPTVTSTVINLFEDVPRDGGTLYGHVWADSIGVLEIELPVPALG